MANSKSGFSIQDLPDQKRDGDMTQGFDIKELPDQINAPRIEALPEQNQAIADAHVNFFSFGVEPGDAEANVEQINGRLASDESAQQLKLNIKTRMIDIQRRRQPIIRRAPEKTLWEEVDGYFRHIFGLKGRDQGEASIANDARRLGITVEEFKRQVVPEGEGLRRVERFISGIGAGAVASIEGMAGSVQWITDGKVGKDLANQAAIWRSEMIPSAEERDFSDDVAGGVGSMAVFFIPGYGVANGIRLLFGASTRFAAWVGTGVMTSMESATEAGMVYRDVLRETRSKTKAEDAATTTFWLNVPLITITNKLGFFTEGGSVLSRAARGGFLEGTQEAGQEVISGVATGDTPRLGDLVRAFGVGAITGAGVGAIQALSQDKTDTDLTERDNEFIQSFQDSLKGVTEEAEAVEVEAGKPVAAEQFEEIIATEATDEAVVIQLLGELEAVTGQAVEADLPQKLADAIGKPNQIEVLEKSGIVTDEAQVEQIIRDEIQSKLDTADAFEARGDLEEATRLREEARQAGETLKEADGVVTERVVDSVLGGEEVGVALTELEISQREARQEARKAQLEQKAAEIEADAIATLQALEEGVDPLPQLESLGNIAFDEGATTIETFTERMKAKLGELWERFKGFIQAVFDKLREERGAIEFGEPTQEQRIAELRTQIQEQVKLARIARREGRSEAVEAARRRINRIRSREAQARVKVRVERATRRTLTELASETLPVALRGKFLKAIANATTPTQFGDVAIRIQSAANAFTEAQELKKNLGSKRGKIAFIRKINEINQTVINDIKKELNISKPLRLMNEKELEAVTEKLKARVRFKRSRGFRPKIEDRGSKRTDIPEALYEVRRNLQPSKKEQFKQKIKKFREESTPEKLLGIISTRLANIDESLRQTLRKFEFNLGRSVRNDLKVATPFIKKVQKMTPDDYTDFGWALKNGDVNTINPLLEKYDMADEFAAVREMLDNIYKRGNDVGFDIGYLENYFPRILQDSGGFLEFLSDREDWSILNEAIKRKELDIGRVLNSEERANLINNMIRGYRGGQITLSATGNMKERVIDFITPEMDLFYRDSMLTLVDYIQASNNGIEARRFFGKTRKEAPNQTESEEEQFSNLEDSMGFYISELLREKKITPSQEKEVREILTARFNQRGITNGFLGLYKNLSYLSVMGSPFNAVTQIGDLAFAIYSGGVKNVAPEIVKSIFNKSRIKKADLGIERLAIEMEGRDKMANLVDRVFKAIGLIGVDRVGKEALINSSVNKYMKEARENPEQLTKTLKPIFEGETLDVINDLQNNFISENVKYLAFNEILNFQPIALSEVPQKYLTAGNGRIFYMLQTWNIKMLDVFRNEVYNEMKTDPVQGLKNMIRLATLLMLMNATADVIKDIMLGREIRLDDLVVDNIVKLIGFSRYTIFQVKREGLGSAIGQQVLPPGKLLDDVSRDTVALFTDFDENFAVDKLRTPENIPIIGKLYYWWFGRGSEIKKERR